MNRDASRNGRSPRRIRAGVEVGGKIERSQFAIARGARAQPHARRMPLRGRYNRFRPRIHHAHRSAQIPCRQRHKRLHRKIELRSESSAHGRRNDANFLRRNARESSRCRRDPCKETECRPESRSVADTARESRFRLNVGMLDESSLVLAFDHDVRVARVLLHIAAHHASAHQKFSSRCAWMRGASAASASSIVFERRQLFPTNGKVREIERLKRLRLAHHRGHRFAAISRFSVRKHWLIRILGNHAVTIDAGDILRGQDQYHARMCADKLIEVAELKSRSVMRTANRTHSQRACAEFRRPQRFRCRRLSSCRRGAPDEHPPLHLLGATRRTTLAPASIIALIIFRYPVQRQSTPPIASMTSPSLGDEFVSSSAVAATSIPGVQAPHCAAPWRERIAAAGRAAARARPIPRPW